MAKRKHKRKRLVSKINQIAKQRTSTPDVKPTKPKSEPVDDHNYKIYAPDDIVDLTDPSMQELTLPSQGHLMYRRIQGMISEYPYGGGVYLNNLLESEINNHGMDKVMVALAEIPDSEIERVERIMYYVGNTSSKEAHDDLKAFAEIIQGFIPDDAQMREIGTIIDSDMTWQEVDTSDTPF